MMLTSRAMTNSLSLKHYLGAAERQEKKKRKERQSYLMLGKSRGGEGEGMNSAIEIHRKPPNGLRAALQTVGGGREGVFGGPYN